MHLTYRMLFGYFPKAPFLAWCTSEFNAGRRPSMRRYAKEVGFPEILSYDQLRERRGKNWFWSPREWLVSKLHYQVPLDMGWDVKLNLGSK